MNDIKIERLTKKYRSLTAVDTISLTVKKGTIFAFLGPNGAGKSTTIKMLTTVAKPTSGRMELAGIDVLQEKQKAREHIGVIFQEHTLDKELTAYENLYYHAVLYQIPKKERKKRIEQMLKYVGLFDKMNLKIKTFSGGMKRRVEIARGLLHSPRILFLDEPTLGLDVQTKTFLWNHIKTINKEQDITVFLTTHNMDEAEKIADEIAIIDNGEILIQGTTDEITQQTKTTSLEEAFLKLTGKTIRDSNITHDKVN
ncbi:MAG: ABC transporter ATP-binding protein [Nanobdellota archaeon]